MQTLPNAVIATTSYNALSQVTSLTQGLVNQTPLASYTYGYDDAGNRKQANETLGGAPIVTIDYTYDLANRLLTETRAGVLTTYAYDDAGNRTSMVRPSGTTGYSYDALDRLTTIDLPTPGANEIVYAYDARGNQTSETTLGVITGSYTWDARDRLTQATVGANVAAYKYDTDGRRTRQTLNTVVTNYLWDEQSAYGDVVVETNNSGAVTASYVLGGSGIISQSRSGLTNYYLSDVQGSTRALITPSATPTITQSYNYDAFGELLAAPPTLNTSYLYTGQQFDSSTGLYSLRARYYDAAVGRFLSRDTWAIDTQNPMELNRYVYAAGNPVRYSDPSGHTLGENLGLNLNTAKRVGAIVAIGTFSVVTLGFVAHILIDALDEISELTIADVLRGDNDPDPTLEPFPFPIGPEQNPDQPPSQPTQTEEQCPTNAAPSSTEPFDETRGLEDIMCNIRKYTGTLGPQPYLWWVQMVGRIIPVFADAWIGFDAQFYPGVGSTESDIYRNQYAVTTGMMLVPRPGDFVGHRSRADVMAFVVHELRHAGQYYNLFDGEVMHGVDLGCDTITAHAAEADAWLQQNHWALRAYPNNPAARKAIKPQAKWRKPR